MFGLFFGSYVWERLKNVALFDASQKTLDPFVGMLSTLVLITGSWFVVIAINAAKASQRRAAVIAFALALASGGAFCVNKYFEYSQKFAHGLSPATNDFFVFYFALTGVHLLHVLIGMVVLTISMRKSQRAVFDERYFVFVESAASYWHMVDLLWIILFPLLYVVN